MVRVQFLLSIQWRGTGRHPSLVKGKVSMFVINLNLNFFCFNYQHSSHFNYGYMSIRNIFREEKKKLTDGNWSQTDEASVRQWAMAEPLLYRLYFIALNSRSQYWAVPSSTYHLQIWWLTLCTTMATAACWLVGFIFKGISDDNRELPSIKGTIVPSVWCLSTLSWWHRSSQLMRAWYCFVNNDRFEFIILENK